MADMAISDPDTFEDQLRLLLWCYKPSKKPWISAEVTLKFPNRSESFTVANLPPPSSPEEPGRPGTNPVWDSAHQNHEGCPGGQSRHSSSPESSSQIENAEMIVEAVGGTESMPLGQASGSDTILFTALEIDIKSEERVEDWSVVHVTSLQNTDPMMDETHERPAEGESLNDRNDAPDLSMTFQIGVKAGSLQNPERNMKEGTGDEGRAVQQSFKPELIKIKNSSVEVEGTGGEGMETDGSNYEPDSSDETSGDSEDEPMVDFAISNVRSLTDPATQARNRHDQSGLDGRGVKEIPCRIGGKGFFSPHKHMTTQSGHIMSIHDGPKRKRPAGQFKCKECSNVYKRKTTLNQHMRVHQADCPFRCNLCQKPWPSKRALARHVRSHTGERPFQCPICETEWGRKDHLANHVRKVHPK